MSADHSFLRPSLLPKLALCGHYRSEEFAGAAADRGTKLDEAFRLLIEKPERFPSNWHEFTEDERTAILWAVKTAGALAGEHRLEAREEFLKIEVGIHGMTGTADLLCPDALWSADLKSGQVRDYEAQQAAYALGFMERFFVDEWTIYLLYCDQQEVETLRFTLESATEIVHDALALWRGGVPPQPNDYCGWCAARWTCSARREQLGLVVPAGEVAKIDLDSMESDKLVAFTQACKTVEDFSGKARDILKERAMKPGVKIPGVSVVSKRGSRTIPAVELEDIATTLLPLLGNVSEKKALEAWNTAQGGAYAKLVPFPSDKVVESGGSTYIMVKPVKAKKA
jgi:hypothetical protein